MDDLEVFPEDGIQILVKKRAHHAEARGEPPKAPQLDPSERVVTFVNNGNTELGLKLDFSFPGDATDDWVQVGSGNDSDGPGGVKPGGDGEPSTPPPAPGPGKQGGGGGVGAADSEGSLVYRASGADLSLPPGARQRVTLAMNSTRVGGGDYKATVNVEVFSGSKQVGTLEFAVQLVVEAEADAFQSEMDLSECERLSWTDVCPAPITLRDVDGFPVAASSEDLKSIELDLFNKKLDERRRGRVAESWDDKIVGYVAAFLKGTMEAKLFINNIPVQGPSKVEVRCGKALNLGDQCACKPGFQDVVGPEEFGSFRTCERCEPCEPGHVAHSSEGAPCACEPCKEGHYCPTQFDELPCPLGSQCPPKSVRPEPCAADTFADEEAMVQCTPCKDIPGFEDATTFGVEGSKSASHCVVCPPQAECEGNATYPQVLLQDAGVPLEAPSCPDLGPYTTVTSQLANPNATEGPGIRYVAFPGPGYFRFPPLSEAGGDAGDACASVDFFACPGGADRCPGERDSAEYAGCAEGYDGFLCMACADGFALTGNSCASCKTVEPYVFAAIGGTVLLLLTGFMAWHTKRKVRARRLKLETGVPRADTLVTILKIGYSHMQVIALMLALDVDWHASVDVIEKLTATITVTSSDLTSSVTCLFAEDALDEDGQFRASGFYGKVVAIYLFPILATILFALVWLGVWFLRDTVTDFRDYVHSVQLTTMILLFLAHIVLVRTALELFVCTHPAIHSRTFLLADPRVECFADGHTAWFVLAGFGGLFFYGAGIPFLSSRLVLGSENEFLQSFLCRNFRCTHLYWESVIAARKVIVTLFFITLEKFGARAQGLALLITLFAALLLQVLNSPYSFAFLNQLETCGIITAMFTLTLALYSLEFEGFESRSAVVLGLNAAIFCGNLAFLSFLVYELVMMTCHVASKGRLAKSSRRACSEPDSPRSRGSMGSRGSRGSRGSGGSKASGAKKKEHPSIPRVDTGTRSIGNVPSTSYVFNDDDDDDDDDKSTNLGSGHSDRSANSSSSSSSDDSGVDGTASEAGSVLHSASYMFSSSNTARATSPKSVPARAGPSQGHLPSPALGAEPASAVPTLGPAPGARAAAGARRVGPRVRVAHIPHVRRPPPVPKDSSAEASDSAKALALM